MGTPQDNPKGYDITNAQHYVRGLTAAYLIMHGTGDDNVHLQNSIQMARQLELARKPFLMKLFPGKTHAIAGAGGTLPLFDELTRFILTNL
jgi:dipeptidyl-peptidase-4